jgi:hypothetical protein
MPRTIREQARLDWQARVEDYEKNREAYETYLDRPAAPVQDYALLGAWLEREEREIALLARSAVVVQPCPVDCQCLRCCAEGE